MANTWYSRITVEDQRSKCHALIWRAQTADSAASVWSNVRWDSDRQGYREKDTRNDTEADRRKIKDREIKR
jgi:hypothetical protein